MTWWQVAWSQARAQQADAHPSASGAFPLHGHGGLVGTGTSVWRQPLPIRPSILEVSCPRFSPLPHPRPWPRTWGFPTGVPRAEEPQYLFPVSGPGAQCPGKGLSRGGRACHFALQRRAAFPHLRENRECRSRGDSTASACFTGTFQAHFLSARPVPTPTSFPIACPALSPMADGGVQHSPRSVPASLAVPGSLESHDHSTTPPCTSSSCCGTSHEAGDVSGARLGSSHISSSQGSCGPCSGVAGKSVGLPRRLPGPGCGTGRAPRPLHGHRRHSLLPLWQL